MGSFKVLLFLCLSVIIGNCNCKQNTIAQHCQLPLESSKFKGGFWPLIFSTKSSDPAVTLQSSAFVVNNDAEVVLSCAPNYFRNIPKTQTVSVTCDGNSGKFDYKSNSKTISKGMDYFSCDLRVIEEVLDPVNGCTKGGFVSTKFGFVQPIEEKTYILGEACYDNEMGRTVFVHVKLDADRYYLEKLQPNYLSSKPHPGSENKIDLLRKLNFGKIYESMEQDLNLKYPIPLELSHYIDPSQWFEVQHRGVLKLGWNYFVKFDAEETFNQLRLAVKSLSLTKAVDVYVGGYGVSVLNNLAKSKELYIDDVAKRFPIPKILWMLVKHENKALGFAVYNNNNEVNSVNSPVAKCETECKQVTWLDTNKDLDSHVLCCTYEELKNIIPDVPDLGPNQMALL